MVRLGSEQAGSSTRRNSEEEALELGRREGGGTRPPGTCRGSRGDERCSGERPHLGDRWKSLECTERTLECFDRLIRQAGASKTEEREHNECEQEKDEER